MYGFDSKWKNFPDYILGITYEIWEERNIASLHQYYEKDILLRTPMGIVEGNQKVISATMATLAELPDRILLGEDVIWSGTPEDGMLSSHRLVTTATHSGDGFFGAATGKKIRVRTMADCHAKNNSIDDEWLIRDHGALVRQLGWTPEEFARHLIEREGGVENCLKPYCPSLDRAGPYRGKGNENEWGARLVDILQRIMQAEVSVIRQQYDRAASLFYSGGQETHSYEGAETFWMGLRSSLPNAELKIHHVIGREDALMPPRAAVRWSLEGVHDGWGYFGTPSGAFMHVMGITHAEFGPWGLRREYTLFDEVALRKQILMHLG